MSSIERFEDLWIWQEARSLVKKIYEDLHECQDWGFKDQIQRAGIVKLKKHLRD